MKCRKGLALGVCVAMICAAITGCSQKKDAPAASAATEQAVTETAAESAAETGQTVTEAEVESVPETEIAEEALTETEVDVEQIMSEQGIMLPFMYSGDDSYLATICSWMETEFGQYYDLDGGVIIPEPVILYTDDSNEEDIKIWGDFQEDVYTLEEETLVNQSGGSNPGLLHLKKTDDASYEVTEFEKVGDGSDYDKDVQRIFSSAPADAGDLVAAFQEIGNNGARDKARWEYLKMYVDEVPQSIKSYKMYGWQPVSLEGTEPPQEFWVEE